MIAHALGNPYDLEGVVAICKKHGLILIEDCCDALGATFHGQQVGTFGDVATCSFYPAHHITMGEGGAVMSNQVRHKRIIESFEIGDVAATANRARITPAATASVGSSATCPVAMTTNTPIPI